MTNSRLRSVDALRGLTVAAMLLVNDPGDWSHVYPWLEHSAWDGCTPADVVFPLFVLIVGVSIALALEPQIAAGATRGALSRAVLARALRLVGLGIALNVVEALLIPGREFRLLGVLARIGICYAGAGIVAVHVRSARAQWALLACVLGGYAAVLVAGGSFAPDANAADRVDAIVLGQWAYAVDPATGRGHDPEGILSTIGALTTVLLGLRAGAWLGAGKRHAVLLGGIVALLLGGVSTLWIPINKQLWTPSFVLWTGGLGLLLLALAAALVDARGWPAVGESLGRNAIAIYAGAWLAACVMAASNAMPRLYAAVFVTPASGTGPFVPSLAFAVVFTALWWWQANAFRRRGWRWSI